MKFEFQLHEGNPSFVAAIRLHLLALKLNAIRILRFGKRMAIYAKKYIPIFCCIVAFELIIIPFGMHLEKYQSWIDGVWDLRMFFFTSILISFVGGILHEEHNRHNNLVKQFAAYKSFMFESECFLHRLCWLTESEYDKDIFLNEEEHDAFRCWICSEIDSKSSFSNRQIQELQARPNSWELYSMPEVKPLPYIKIVFDCYLRTIDSLQRVIDNYSFIGTIDHLKEQLTSIYEHINEELIIIETTGDNYTEVQLLKFIELSSRCIYPAVADIRRPWRWDVEINKTMQVLLNKKMKSEFQ